MALSTTQSIWRSGGGDQTRTAYCGTGLMAAQFYIADAGPASTTNIKVSAAPGANDLILPAGAVILTMTFQYSATGTSDIGWATLDGSASNTDGLITGQTLASSLFDYNGNVGADFGLVMSATKMIYLTVTDNTAGAGSTYGYITYFVTDPLVGQQNV